MILNTNKSLKGARLLIPRNFVGKSNQQPPSNQNQYAEIAIAKTKLILKNYQCPGDHIGVNTAIDLLHEQYPDEYLTDVRSNHPDVYRGNPNITPLDSGQEIDMHCPLINRSNQRPVHFLDSWLQHLANNIGRPLELTSHKPRIHLTPFELVHKPSCCPVGRYAVINAGWKNCYTLKHPGHYHYQAIVDAFPNVTFVQVGDSKENNRLLTGSNVVNLIGKTSVRDYIRLIYWSDFVVCCVTSTLHIAAAFEKHSFCFNSREPNSWLYYPKNTMFSMGGLMPCNLSGACWKTKANPNEKHASTCSLPVLHDGEWIGKCMQLIDTKEVTTKIQALYSNGLLTMDYEQQPPAPPVPANAKTGVVIGTFGSVPYIHLLFETLKRNQPSLPVLLVDDCSNKYKQLAKLCEQYGATFIANPKRLGHYAGDVSCFVHGLNWANSLGLDLLVKFSRRWVVNREWLTELQQIASSTQMPTYSNRCDNYGFTFRSECVGLSVAHWLHAIPKLLEYIDTNNSELPESYYRGITDNLPLNAYAKFYKGDNFGYAVWNLLGTNRHIQHDAKILWHNACPPEYYCAMARELGLDYRIEDFRHLD